MGGWVGGAHLQDGLEQLLVLVLGVLVLVRLVLLVLLANPIRPGLTEGEKLV